MHPRRLRRRFPGTLRVAPRGRPRRRDRSLRRRGRAGLSTWRARDHELSPFTIQRREETSPRSQLGLGHRPIRKATARPPRTVAFSFPRRKHETFRPYRGRAPQQTDRPTTRSNGRTPATMPVSVAYLSARHRETGPAQTPTFRSHGDGPVELASLRAALGARVRLAHANGFAEIHTGPRRPGARAGAGARARARHPTLYESVHSARWWAYGRQGPTCPGQIGRARLTTGRCGEACARRAWWTGSATAIATDSRTL